MSFSQSPTFKVGLTAEEKQLYSSLFKSLDTEGTGIVSGEKARSTFEKSGLPPNILGEIWQLADVNNLGFLTQFGFCLAMRLIGQTQAGNHPTLASAEVPGPLPKFAGLSIPNQLAPQSTNSSFLQHSDEIGPVSPVDYQKFSQLFLKTVGSLHGVLPGTRARDIFLKAKLPNQTLGIIWNLVDKENKGALDLKGFVVAMHLIHAVLSGRVSQLPPTLPESVWSLPAQSPSQQQPQFNISRQSSGMAVPQYQTTSSNVGSPRLPSNSSVTSTGTVKRQSVTSPSANSWIIPNTLKLQYEHVFDNMDKNKSGYISSDQMASMLMSSKLSQEDLALVWDLSDIQNTGIFTKTEFVIALFLVNRRLAGEQLPNVIPQELIDSVKAANPHSQSQIEPVNKPLQSPTTSNSEQVKPKTNMDDLVDIFGSTPIPQTSQTPKASSNLSGTSGSKDGPSSPSNLTDVPKVRKSFTGSFKPTSTFGQSLMKENTGELNLLRENSDTSSFDSKSYNTQPTSQPAQQKSTSSSTGVEQPKAINYDALRSVPPPPVPKSSTNSVQSSGSRGSAPAVPAAPVSRQSSQIDPQRIQSPPNSQRQGQQPQQQQPVNNDLLADSSISKEFSQATTDIANVSNQIKSLSDQTTGLQEKKKKAEQELARILTTKRDIEVKLKQLKSSYSNEVKQVEQVEENLVSAREETEALRSQCSISEARYNALTTELNDKQVSMENLQKENASTKEKLGTLNAEIVELEKQVTNLTSENQRLSNQLNVKKSQVQVSIVKVEELKSKLNEIETSNKNLAEKYRQQEEEELQAEKEAKILEEKINLAKKNKPTPPVSRSKRHSTQGAGVAAGGIAAAAATGMASIAADASSSTRNIDNIASPEPSLDSKSKDVIEDSAKTPTNLDSENDEHLKATGDSNSSVQEEPQLENYEDDAPVIKANKEVSSEPTIPSAVSESNSVSTSQNLTSEPVADIPVVDSSDLPGAYPQVEEDVGEDFDSKFPKVEATSQNSITGMTKVQNEQTESTTSSTFQDDFNETPRTSPNNSEFQFPQGANAGISGTMLGMPGVPVGVSRTESLTSSVQNNAAMSVRDDNISISDHETLQNANDEKVAKAVNNRNRDISPPTQHQEDSDKFSSGVESFEMVNADDVKSSHHDPYSNSIPNVSSTSSTAIAMPRSVKEDQREEEEFPPIRELDYDESDSSDENDSSDVHNSSDGNGVQDKFDDAVDHLSTSQEFTPSGENVKKSSSDPAIDFDDAFDGLEPAKEEVQESSTSKSAGQELFGDFEGLEEAKPEDATDEFAMDQNYFNDDFTNQESNFPNFDNQPTDNTGDDEWEKLFAGFGNSGTLNEVNVAVPASSESNQSQKELTTSSTPFVCNQDLIDELVGMGFDHKTATDALEKNNGDLEAATNYLLDNA